MVHNENTPEQVEFQLPVAQRVKVKLTQACPLKFCFSNCHFGSSLSPRCKAIEVMASALRYPCCFGRSYLRRVHMSDPSSRGDRKSVV